MLDVLYVGLTVAFFVAVAALAKGTSRLTGLDSSPASAQPSGDTAVSEPATVVTSAEPRP